jgi:hypothetical protein
VVQLRLRWLTPALGMSRVAIPAAFIAWLRRGVIGAVSPSKDPRATHRAASITSAESTGSVTCPPAHANEKPSSMMSSGVRRISCAACPSGSLVESRLTHDAICVDRHPSSPSAVPNHSWPARLDGLPRARSCYRLHGSGIRRSVGTSQISHLLAANVEFGGLASGCSATVARIKWMSEFAATTQHVS